MKVTNGTASTRHDYNVEKTENDHDFKLTLAGATEGERSHADASLNGAEVEVYFTANLNKNAKLGKEGNVNGAKLTYSNTSTSDDEEDEDELPWDYVIAFTYKVDVNKVDPAGEALEGAEFKLEKKLADGTEGPSNAHDGRQRVHRQGPRRRHLRPHRDQGAHGLQADRPITFTVTPTTRSSGTRQRADTQLRDRKTWRTQVLTGLTAKTSGDDHARGGRQDLAPLTGNVKNTELDKPEFEKKIEDINDSTGEISDWQDSADYDIGDAVPYKLTATLSKDVTSFSKYHVTFEDQMEPSLTFNKIEKVELVTKGEDGTTTEITDYDFKQTDDQHFTLTVAWAGKENEDRTHARIADATLNEADVNVYFTATLNEDAKIGAEGNVNQARLHYSNNADSEDDNEKDEDTTDWDFVIAFTYKLQVNKTYVNNEPVEPPTFELQKKLKDGTKNRRRKYDLVSCLTRMLATAGTPSPSRAWTTATTYSPRPRLPDTTPSVPSSSP